MTDKEFKVGDLVKRKGGKRKHEVGFVIKVLSNNAAVGDHFVRVQHSVRVQWTDGLKWNHLPDSLIKV